MPAFSYVATDYTGQRIKGQIEARDRASVIASLRKDRLVIISIKEARESIFFRKGGRVKLEDLIVFTRQLAALVKAGVSLVKSLNILSAQVENRTLKEIISAVLAKIESGSSLSEALAGYPKVFSGLYINMIRAGEMSGALDTILERLALYLEGIGKLNNKVRSAFVYPIIIIVVAVSITAVIFIKVIPGFKSIFDSLNVELPLITKIVLRISDLSQKYFLLFLLLAIAPFVALKSLSYKPRFRLAQDKLKLRLPILGNVIRKVIVARFSRTLSTLLKSGVSILAALQIGSTTSGNMVIEATLNKVIDRVSKGEKIGESLAENKVFAPLVVNLVAVGEETGDIGSMLDKIATFYEDEVDTAVSAMVSMIEPVIIIFLGVLIGGIVISMFLPIFKLTQVIGT
jgi:type IV pilus assembly protein PilC